MRSGVNSRNFTSHTNSGLTQVILRGTRLGMLANGLLSMMSGSSFL